MILLATTATQTVLEAIPKAESEIGVFAEAGEVRVGAAEVRILGQHVVETGLSAAEE